MSRPDLRGVRAVVVGGAGSGRAAARLLVAEGARVTLTDTQPTLDGADALRADGIELVLGEHPPALFDRAALIVLSPGVNPAQSIFDPPRARGVEVIGEMELASRFLKGRVIAVTGTKGKSTTTSLLGQILTAAGHHAPAGGNLGPALAGQVASSTPSSLHVVEVSSFQLETSVTFHPWIAVLLNLSPDHLDRHASFDDYAAAKRRVLMNQTDQDWVVINADDAGAMALAHGARARQARVSLDARSGARVTVTDGWIVERSAEGERRIMPTANIHLLGPHLVTDVLAAVMVARLVGVEPEIIAQVVAEFRGLEHAMELVDDIDGVRFVNDSKATNVEAARQSIETFTGRLAVIMGGRFKGGDLGLLSGPLAARRATVVAIGEATPLLHAAFDGVVPVVDARSMAEAVATAADAMRGGGCVVLAPACASFDMFEHYAARGAAFKAAVAQLRRLDVA